MSAPRRSGLLVLALALFGLVALLRPGAPATTESPRRAPRSVRYPTAEQHQRMTERRTLPPRPSQPSGPQGAEQGKRDPLLSAIPGGARSMVVFEASTFFALPIGRMLMRCLDAEGQDELLGQGVDVRRIERVAYAETADGHPLMLLSGDFKELLPAGLTKDAGATYGDKAHVFAPGEPDAGAGGGAYLTHAALWNDQLWVSGARPEDVHAAIDRVEGRRDEAEPFPASEAYGEMYGRLDARTMENLFSGSRVQLADANLHFDFHADATEDVLLAVDATGDPDKTRELGKTLASALALKRAQATQQGDGRLAALLDEYAVRLEDGSFQLEAVLPREMVQELLGSCARGDSDDDAPPDEDDE